MGGRPCFLPYYPFPLLSLLALSALCYYDFLSFLPYNSGIQRQPSLQRVAAKFPNSAVGKNTTIFVHELSSRSRTGLENPIAVSLSLKNKLSRIKRRQDITDGLVV